MGENLGQFVNKSCAQFIQIVEKLLDQIVTSGVVVSKQRRFERDGQCSK